MPSDKTKRDNAPLQILLAEAERKTKLAEKEREETIELMAEKVALANDPDAEISMRGKKIMRHGTRRKRQRTEDTENTIRAIFSGKLIANAITLTGIHAAQEMFNQTFLSGKFTSNAGKPAPSPHLYEDKDYIYDTANVSPKTLKVLEDESAIIEEKLRRLLAIENPEQHETFAKEIARLAEDFQMRRHPVTQRYIHDIARVEHEESIHNANGHVPCTGTVCVFRVKAQIGDLRGMKQQIGDVYNQDPAEVIATGDHLKGPNAPAP